MRAVVRRFILNLFARNSTVADMVGAVSMVLIYIARFQFLLDEALQYALDNNTSVTLPGTFPWLNRGIKVDAEYCADDLKIMKVTVEADDDLRSLLLAELLRQALISDRANFEGTVVDNSDRGFTAYVIGARPWRVLQYTNARTGGLR